MNILILCVTPQLESIQKLIKCATQRGHNSKVISLKMIPIGEIDFGGFDLIINRVSGISYNDTDLERLESIENDIFIINRPSVQRIFRDKYGQYQFYIKNNISTIETLSLEVSTRNIFKEFIESYKSQSFIIKPLRSNQARGIIICNSMNECLKTYQKLEAKKDLRYIIQPFIKSTTEWRLLFIGHRHICTMLKQHRPGSSHHNILNCHNSKLSQIKEENIPTNVFQIAKKVSKLTRLHILACDIILTPQGEAKLIEVNTVPGMKYVEQVCNIDVSAEILNSINT